MTAAGDVLYASGANTLAKLAKGSDDDVLTLASGVPSWAASAGGGAWTLISTQTGDDVMTYMDFLTLSTDYRDFRLIGSSVTPGTDAPDAHFQISTSGGGIVGSGYTWGMTGINEDATARNTASGSASQISLTYSGVGNVSGENFYFDITVEDVHSTVNQKLVWFESSTAAYDNKYEEVSGGGRNGGTTGALNGFRFKFASGTIKSGTVTLYGRKTT